MKVVTVYKRTSDGVVGYKCDGKLYGFLHKEPEIVTAKLVAEDGGEMYSAHSEEYAKANYNYTGKRYVFK